MLNRLGISALVAASISFSSVPAFAESKGTIAYLLPDSGGPFYPDAGKILKEFLQQETRTTNRTFSSTRSTTS
jgi:ABC-type sugar transport system substrate-binding protein